MGYTLLGITAWSMSRDSEGHREYKLKSRVKADTGNDGPGGVLATPGLTAVGAPWNFGNDFDIWAWCRPDAVVTPVYDREVCLYYDVEQVFSTRPPRTDAFDPATGAPNGQEDPLLQPAKVSGGFAKGRVEATHNYNGVPILTSSFEMLRGSQVEFDSNTPTVKITQNVALLNLPLLSLMCDTVNASPIWGLASRTVKLSNVSWERKFNGLGGTYYERSLEFDINYRTHDRVLLDEGTKALNGHFDQSTGNWVLDNIGGAAPSALNPHHFSVFKDRAGENSRVILNGAGLPSSVMVGVSQVAASYSIGDSVTYLGSTYLCVVGNINVNPATSASGDAASRKWIAQVGSLGDFQDSVNYVVGNLVTNDDSIYVCNTVSPAGTAFGQNWTYLGESITDRGAWQGSSQAVPTGGAGYVYVTYYRGTNMLLLGIPLTF